MRTSSLSFAGLLIAAGAILAWAVTTEVEGVDLSTVGLILFAVGIGLAVITVVAGAMPSRTTVDSERETVVNGDRAVEHRRDTVDHS